MSDTEAPRVGERAEKPPLGLLRCVDCGAKFTGMMALQAHRATDHYAPEIAALRERLAAAEQERDEWQATAETLQGSVLARLYVGAAERLARAEAALRGTRAATLLAAASIARAEGRAISTAIHGGRASAADALIYDAIARRLQASADTAALAQSEEGEAGC